MLGTNDQAPRAVHVERGPVSARTAMPRPLPPSPLPLPFHATTSNALDGFDVVDVLGIVRGITVRSRSIVGTVGAKFQQIVGGEVSLLTELCEQTRARSFEIAVEHAIALGANGLIALRYDATEIMSGVSEVLCYGTAVRVVERRTPTAPL